VIIITRNGRPVAALLAVQDEEEIERLVLAHSPRLRSILQAAQRQICEGAGISHEDFWREMDQEEPSKERPKRKRKSA